MVWPRTAELILDRNFLHKNILYRNVLSKIHLASGADVVLVSRACTPGGLHHSSPLVYHRLHGGDRNRTPSGPAAPPVFR